MLVQTSENRLKAKMHVVALLNEVEFFLRELGEDQEKVAALAGALYDLVDKD
jgi:predicted hydrolase (HD superfamily)